MICHMLNYDRLTLYVTFKSEKPCQKYKNMMIYYKLMPVFPVTLIGNQE